MFPIWVLDRKTKIVVHDLRAKNQCLALRILDFLAKLTHKELGKDTLDLLQ